jgi:spore coat polysaccharide biosynthesis predicted glycosyltransferase SpsG
VKLKLSKERAMEMSVVCNSEYWDGRGHSRRTRRLKRELQARRVPILRVLLESVEVSMKRNR